MLLVSFSIFFFIFNFCCCIQKCRSQALKVTSTTTKKSKGKKKQPTNENIIENNTYACWKKHLSLAWLMYTALIFVSFHIIFFFIHRRHRCRSILVQVRAILPWILISLFAHFVIFAIDIEELWRFFGSPDYIARIFPHILTHTSKIISISKHFFLFRHRRLSLYCDKSKCRYDQKCFRCLNTRVLHTRHIKSDLLISFFHVTYFALLSTWISYEHVDVTCPL